MSNVLYPLAAIESLRVSPFNRVITDPFESGAVASRRLWTTQEFKRDFLLQHAPLFETEANALKAFYRARDGAHDTFWFRDNVNRNGNAKVRFAQPLSISTSRLVRSANVQLQEAAPIRLMAQIEDIASAAGTAPVLWWDANRIRYYEHPLNGARTVYQEATIPDAMGNYPGTWQHGSTPVPGNITGQWQYFGFTGTEYAKSAPITQITGAKPAITLMAFFYDPDPANSVNVMVGSSTGAGCAAGIGVDNDSYQATDGATYPGPANSNEPDNSWRCYTVGLASGSDDFDFWNADTLVGSGTFTTRNYAGGPLTLGANVSGSSKCASGARMAHILLWNVKLNTSQVGAVYSALSWQYPN